MSGFIKKALGVFVEFDDEKAEKVNTGNDSISANLSSYPQASITGKLAQDNIEKFSKHFSDLFDQANLPGPDYYEFAKMMDMLESAIPDEKARIAAVFATLSIQGLAKAKIINTAKQYSDIVDEDKAAFEKAANDKANAQIAAKKDNVSELEKKIADNGQTIQRLTQEINDAQAQISNLKKEIETEGSKISANIGGYMAAYQAIKAKINNDITKINEVLK